MKEDGAKKEEEEQKWTDHKTYKGYDDVETQEQPNTHL